MSGDNPKNKERGVPKRKVSVDMIDDKDLFFATHEPNPSNPEEKRITYIWSAGETLLRQVFGTGGILCLVAIISYCQSFRGFKFLGQ